MVLVTVLAVLMIVWCGYKFRQRFQQQKHSVLHESFLGGDGMLPGPKLAEADVPARWARAAQTADLESGLRTGSATGSTSSVTGSTARRRRKGESGDVHVMFSSEHVRELQPSNWQDTPLAHGSYGLVYKATWRRQDVAVKVMKLPEREAGATSAAEELLKKKVQEVLRDFVAEVEVCCDLNHPNLVRLLGYADRPVPMMMQQLLFMSLDKLLYVESWEPALDDQLKVAHDVAMGMEYLHTCFQHEGSNQDQPIIHRDLKTPNLLLTGHPAEGHFDVKITDFGLSRDKGLDDEQYRETVMMTGCGSALWMAPEILLGETYNEKIDVFSCASSCPALCSPLRNPIKAETRLCFRYAMCLVEVVSSKLPWTGVATGATR